MKASRLAGPRVVHPGSVTAASAASAAATAAGVASPTSNREGWGAAAIMGEVASITGRWGAFATGVGKDVVATGPQGGGGRILGVGFLLGFFKNEGRASLKEGRE